MRVEIGSPEYVIIRELKHVARCERLTLMAFKVKMFPADHRRSAITAVGAKISSIRARIVSLPMIFA